MLLLDATTEMDNFVHQSANKWSIFDEMDVSTKTIEEIMNSDIDFQEIDFDQAERNAIIFTSAQDDANFCSISTPTTTTTTEEQYDTPASVPKIRILHQKYYDDDGCDSDNDETDMDVLDFPDIQFPVKADILQIPPPPPPPPPPPRPVLVSVPTCTHLDPVSPPLPPVSVSVPTCTYLDPVHVSVSVTTDTTSQHIQPQTPTEMVEEMDEQTLYSFPHTPTYSKPPPSVPSPQHIQPQTPTEMVEEMDEQTSYSFPPTPTYPKPLPSTITPFFSTPDQIPGPGAPIPTKKMKKKRSFFSDGVPTLPTKKSKKVQISEKISSDSKNHKKKTRIQTVAFKKPKTFTKSTFTSKILKKDTIHNDSTRLSIKSFNDNFFTKFTETVLERLESIQSQQKELKSKISKIQKALDEIK